MIRAIKVLMDLLVGENMDRIVDHLVRRFIMSSRDSSIMEIIQNANNTTF